MYQRIMTAVDGSASSTRALHEAIRMAKLAQAKVFAVYVVDKTLLFSYAGYYDPLVLLDGMRRDGRNVLADAESALREAGVAGEAELIETDDIGDEIASCLQRHVLHLGADLVVLGTHGRRGLRRAVLGSVAERFLRASTVPVLLVRGADDKAPASASE